jgi:hypothetical protein
MGLLKLFNRPAQKELLNAATIATAFQFPPITSGNDITIEYQALMGNRLPYEVIAPGAYSLEIGIFKADGTQLAFQNTWTADGARQIYTGSLSTSDAAMTTAVSGATPTAPYEGGYLEIVYIDASGKRHNAIKPTALKIYKNLLPAGAVTVPPGSTAMTVEHGENTFTKKIVPLNEIFAFTSSAGYIWRFSIDDNGKPDITRLS